MAVIPCDLCNGEEAVMLQTALVNGDTVGVGASCMIGFYLGVLTELTGDMPREVAETYDDVLAVIIKNMAPSMINLAATAQKRPRGRRVTAPPPPPSVPDDQRASVLAANDNGPDQESRNQEVE